MPIDLMDETTFTQYCIDRDTKFANELEEKINFELNKLSFWMKTVREMRIRTKQWKKELGKSE